MSTEVDEWLMRCEAAKYIGVSFSTLASPNLKAGAATTAKPSTMVTPTEMSSRILFKSTTTPQTALLRRLTLHGCV